MVLRLTDNTGILQRDAGEKLGRLRQAGNGKIDAARRNFVQSCLVLLSSLPPEQRAMTLDAFENQFNGNLSVHDWVRVLREAVQELLRAGDEHADTDDS